MNMHLFAEADLHKNAKAIYRQNYFNALHLAISSIKTKFMQSGYIQDLLPDRAAVQNLAQAPSVHVHVCT